MRVLRRLFTTALCALLILASLAVPAAASESPGRTIKVGVTGKMAPLLYIDEEGKSRGAFTDMMAYIADRSGYKIEYVKYKLSYQALSALETSEIDAVLGVFPEKLTPYPNLEMSRDLYTAPLCIASSNATKVGDYGLFGAYEMDSIDFKLIDILDVDFVNGLTSQELVLDYLIYGPSYRILVVRDCVVYRLNHDNLTKNYTIQSGNVSYVNYGIALRSDNGVINNAINGGISSLRNGNQYDTILTAWGIQNEIEAANAKWFKTIAIVIAVAGTVVLLFVGISMRLRVLVRIKTAELSEKLDELEHSSSLRNVLLEKSSAGSMVLKLDGTILFMNDAMRQLAGFTNDEDIKNVKELGFVNNVWEIARPEMDSPELYTERDADGKQRIYRYQNHRTAHPDERVFIMEDITREEAEKQEAYEKDKNKALNRIIAGVAHEIKNPLTTIRNFAILIDKKGSTESFQKAFREYVPGEVDRISKMIETLINYARPPRQQKSRISVSDLVKDSIGLSYLSAKKNIDVKYDIANDMYIYVNSDQVRQALINLMLNSMETVEAKMEQPEFAGLPRNISISSYRNGGDVVIEIYDDGMGMSEDNVRLCTDPFFTTKKNGTGMGLALTKQFIQENGGSLEIESKQGEYTRMKMIFKEDTNNETDSMDH